MVGESMKRTKEYYQKKLDRINERLDLYLEAEKKILDGAQSYTIGSRSLTRADLASVRSMIETLEEKADELESVIDGGSKRKAIGVVPRDW